MRSRSKSYGQFCHVAKASQILGERWTLLLVRELLLGSTRFSELQRALPKASPTILTKRLKDLEFAGVVERNQTRGRQYAEYRLSVSGQELGTLIDAMGTWAARWAMGRLQKEELDEYFLILDVSRRIRRDAIPSGTATVGFRFRPGHGDPDWWIVIDPVKAEICDADPGFALDLLVSGSLRTITEVWLGHKAMNKEIADGHIRITGQPRLERSCAQWLGFSAYAKVGSTPFSRTVGLKD